MNADRPLTPSSAANSPPHSAAENMAGDRRSSLRRRLLDRLALRPSRQPLDPGPQLRHWIDSGGLRLEAFRQFKLRRPEQPAEPATAGPVPGLLDPNALAAGDHPPPQRVIIKYAGNAGRAERSTWHPAEAWADQNVEIWTINPPGYGQSPGRASLDHVPALAAAVWQAIAQHYRDLPELPVVILGNSIGALTALHTVLAAQSLGGGADPAVDRVTGSPVGFPASSEPTRSSAVRDFGPGNAPESRRGLRVSGLLLRNPPDLVPLILQHRRRWYHGPVPAWLVRAWGPEIDSVGLIAGCHCPLLLLQSEWDREVPPSNQDRLWAAHPGPKHKFIVPAADHEQLPTPAQPDLYHRYLQAIRTHL